ncbi:MAG: LysR family transcriptional regulator [Pseudomonadota bacterium]
MKASLDDLHLYLRIVETGSLRAAASELGADPSVVSRKLSGLEERLGVKLISRSRVRSVPTDAGRAYYGELKPLLERMEALEDQVAGAADEPRGVLRVAAPIDFGARYIGPWLHELSARSPHLAVELIVSDRFVDMTEQSIDVAIRIGALQDSPLIARRLGAMPLAIVTSQTYLSGRDPPLSPEDLKEHDFVLYSGLQAGTDLTLAHQNGDVEKVRCNSRFSVNNLGGVARIVEAGGGLHAGPLWYFAEAIEDGHIVQVLPDWAPPAYPVHALYEAGAYIPAKIRRFVDLAVARMRATPGIVAQTVPFPGRPNRG